MSILLQQGSDTLSYLQKHSHENTALRKPPWENRLLRLFLECYVALPEKKSYPAQASDNKQSNDLQERKRSVLWSTPGVGSS